MNKINIHPDSKMYFLVHDYTCYCQVENATRSIEILQLGMVRKWLSTADHGEHSMSESESNDYDNRKRVRCLNDSLPP